jgi:hypothetical protein
MADRFDFPGPSTLLRAVAGLVLAGACATATAQAPDGVENFLFPANGLSSADAAHVLYGEKCGSPRTDPQQAPQVIRDGNRITVDIFLVRPVDEVCTAVVLPPTLVPVALGPLAKGTWDVRRRLWVRDPDDRVHRPLHDAASLISVGDVPNPAVSGVWFDAARGGEGLVVTLLPASEGNAPQGLLYFAAKDVAGRAQWFTGVGSFVDGVLTVALSPGGDPGLAPSAQATFRYQGCGRASFRFAPAQPSLSTFEASYRQLTAVQGLPSCVPPRVLGG